MKVSVIAAATEQVQEEELHVVRKELVSGKGSELCAASMPEG
jgi:hypothetical protein